MTVFFGRFKRTGKRDQIFLATKFGFVLGQSGVVDGRPEYVKTAAELSLKKLGVDVVDLYYLHVCSFISSLLLIILMIMGFLETGSKGTH